MVVRGSVERNAFARFKAEIEPVVLSVPFLKMVHDFQALEIVFKAAIVFQNFAECFLPRMPERGMAKVVGVGNGFAQVLV